ncbi:ABC transporter permease [Brucella cytisi]|uniref:ABC transporter permease n=1 Tax=Brucella cytisi TaxID=407152 RepID=UPI0035DA7512
MADASHNRSLRMPKGAWLPLGLIALWALVAISHAVDNPLFVSPMAVLLAPFADPSGREIWASVAISIARVLTGGFIGMALGLLLGTVCGLWSVAAFSLAPSIHTFRQIAVFGWIPLFTAWFGNGEVTKLVFTALSTFFPVFLATEQGIRATPLALKEVAQTLELPFRPRLIRLYLPAALPSIQIGIQIAALSAWIGTIGAEYAIGNGRGLGNYIASARDQFRMDIVLVGVFVLAAGGVMLNRISTSVFARLSV